MASVLISITLTPEEKLYLEELNLSPTKLLKAAIAEHRTNFMVGEEIFKETRRKLEAFTELSRKYREFIEKKGLLDEFLKENGAK